MLRNKNHELYGTLATPRSHWVSDPRWRRILLLEETKKSISSDLDSASSADDYSLDSSCISPSHTHSSRDFADFFCCRSSHHCRTYSRSGSSTSTCSDSCISNTDRVASCIDQSRDMNTKIEKNFDKITFFYKISSLLRK